MTAEVLLFAYGTLQDPAVQTAVFGRALAQGAPDQLSGFRLSHIPIDAPPVDAPQVTAETGLTHYPILIPTTDDAPPVPGRLYPLTPAELTAADAYEGEAYRRVRVTTEAGAEAWVYVAAAGGVRSQQWSRGGANIRKNNCLDGRSWVMMGGVTSETG